MGFCGACGARLHGVERFCADCGSAVAPQAAPTTPSAPGPVQAPARRSRVLAGVLALVVVATGATLGAVTEIRQPDVPETVVIEGDG